MYTGRESRRHEIETSVVIAALGSVITTLAGAVALLYRAQVAALKEHLTLQKEQSALHERYAQEQAREAGFWRTKYFEADVRVDGALVTLADAIAIAKDGSPRRGR